jgi:DedD protein
MKTKKEKKPSPGQEPPKNTLFWICLIFFVSVWMFVLGILVGRGTAPVHFDIEKLQKELEELKTAVLKKELQRYKIDSARTVDKPDLGFHEALKSPKDDDRLDHDISSRSKKKKAVSKPAGLSGTVGDKNTAAFKRIPKSGRLFTIQVASSKDASFADNLVARLNKKGIPAYRREALIPGKGIWYRVRIGGFNNRTEAVHVLDRLKQKNLKGIIVKRE